MATEFSTPILIFSVAIGGDHQMWPVDTQYHPAQYAEPGPLHFLLELFLQGTDKPSDIKVLSPLYAVKDMDLTKL